MTCWKLSLLLMCILWQCWLLSSFMNCLPSHTIWDTFSLGSPAISQNASSYSLPLTCIYIEVFHSNHTVHILWTVSKAPRALVIPFGQVTQSLIWISILIIISQRYIQLNYLSNKITDFPFNVNFLSPNLLLNLGWD